MTNTPTATFTPIPASTPTPTPTPASGVAAPLSTQDIGAVALAGSASYSGGTFTLTASGEDIEDNADQFRYVYQPLTGDGTILARVKSLQNTDPWAKAGVMIRETLDTSSAHAMMVLTPGNGLAFQRRLMTGATTIHSPGSKVVAPYWVRLVRSGNTFTGYSSPDGTTWTVLGSQTIAMASNVLVGLVLTSHNNATLGTATLDNVAIPRSVSLTSPGGNSFPAPANISLTTAASDPGATITRVDFYNGATLVGSSTSAPFNFTWTNVGSGAYGLTARATDSLGAVFTSALVPVTVGLAAPPAPWADQDIGSPGAVGSTNYSSGTFTVNGAGTDIWGLGDKFHYVYQPLTGDATIVARVTSVQNTDPWSKAGVMIRETLSASSAHAMMILTASNGLAFQRRLATGLTSVNTTGSAVPAPYWVKVVRSGNTFTGYQSPDGSTWTQVDSATIPMGASVYVGLAVTSLNNGVICAANLDNVTASPGVH